MELYDNMLVLDEYGEGIVKRGLQSFAIVILAVAFNLNNLAAADTNDSSQVQPPNPTPTTFATLMVSLNISTTNNWSGCVTPGTPPGTGHGTWGSDITICPSNSTINTNLSISSSDAHNCLCQNTNCSNTGISGVTMLKTGNLGIGLSSIKCTVPVQAWIPSSILANAGNNTSVPVTLLGSSVFINYQNGTTPYIQPTAAKSYFDINYSGARVIGGDNTAFTSQLIPGGIQTYRITYPGCIGSTGC